MAVYELENQPNALVVDAGLEAVMNRMTERFVTGTRMERLGYGSTMFEIVYQDRRRLTVQRRRYSFGLFLFLSLFLFVPGLIYMMVARHKPRVTTLMISRRESDGRTHIEVSGNDEEALRGILRFAREELAQEPSPAEQPPKGSTLTGRLRELAESKDAGLITQEEDEVKRAEILKRM